MSPREPPITTTTHADPPFPSHSPHSPHLSPHLCPRSYLEVPRHLGCQLFGVLCDLVVEVDGGCVLEQLALFVHSCHHLRMTVAHAHRHNPGKRLSRPRSGESAGDDHDEVRVHVMTAVRQHFGGDHDRVLLSRLLDP